MNCGRLKGRNCLIVGGTGGLGLASARRFLEEGARVVVAGARPGLDESVLCALGPPSAILQLPVDVTIAEEVDRLFSRVRDFLAGRLDVLFHIAGVSGRRFGDGPLHECSDEGWETVLDVNARGTFLANRAAVRFMRSQDLDVSGLRGTVINVGSVLSQSPSPRYFGTIAYSASKGAVRSLTLSAASTYAGDRIRFNLIEPGLIDTPMAARAVKDPAIQAFLATKQPLAEGPGLASDVAEAAVYLAEPASRFVTGAVLRVDGGWAVSEGQYPP